MCFMLCSQHLVLPIVVGQFEDPPIVNQPKGQDRKNPPKMPTREHSVIGVSTGSQTGIVLEDVIVEHTLEAGDKNNGKDYDNTIPPLGLVITAGGGNNDGNDSTSKS